MMKESMRQLKSVNGYEIWKCRTAYGNYWYDVYDEEDLLVSFKTLREAHEWCE